MGKTTFRRFLIKTVLGPYPAGYEFVFHENFSKYKPTLTFDIKGEVFDGPFASKKRWMFLDSENEPVLVETTERKFLRLFDEIESVVIDGDFFVEENSNVQLEERGGSSRSKWKEEKKSRIDS
jgi:hypothetical protein